MSRGGPSNSMQTASQNGVAPQRSDSSTSSSGMDTESSSTGRTDDTPPRPVSRLAVYSTHIPEPTVSGLCGAVAGIASGIVTCPLDVIKTRLQAQSSFRRSLGPRLPNAHLYNGLIGTARTIWLQDGLRGMYRGLGPMLLGYLPTWTVYMSVYEQARGYYHSHLDNKTLARAMASVTAGACSTLVTNPIWVIKTRLMSQVGLHAPAEARPPWQYRGTFDAAYKMYRSEGLKVFYSGLGPALLGLSHVAIQFPLYEFLKERFTGLEMGENYLSDQEHSNYYVGISSATFLSKVTATCATYPHEVLRTRLQLQQRSLAPEHSHEGIAFRGGLGHVNTSRGAGTASSDGMINVPRYRGLVRTVKTMLAEEGWRAFYNGMGTNLLRAVPAAMTTMLTYETLKTVVHKLQQEGKRAEDGDL